MTWSRAGFVCAVLISLVALLRGVKSGQTVSTQFFGMNIIHTDTPWPSQPFSGIRLWDSDGTSWSQLNPARGQFNWSSLDRWLAVARQNDVDVVYTFGRVPGWANGGQGQSVPPSDLADWDAFVRGVVQHSKGQIKAYELWNEPNGTQFWTGDLPTLLTMAERACNIIKAAQPDAIVLTPAATWSDTSPVQWFDQYFAAGGGQFADAIAFHG
jgi:hypothetical protein